MTVIVSSKGTLPVDGVKNMNRCPVFMVIFLHMSLHHSRGEERKNRVCYDENGQRALFYLSFLLLDWYGYR